MNLVNLTIKVFFDYIITQRLTLADIGRVADIGKHVHNVILRPGAEMLAGFVANQQHLAVFALRHSIKLLLRKPQQVDIVAAAESAVAGNYNIQNIFHLFTRLQKWSIIFFAAGQQVIHNLLNFIRIRAYRHQSRLRFAQFGCRNHFHGLGNLLGAGGGS